VDLRTDLGNLEMRKFLTLPGLELRPLGRPARIYSLYRLSYPGYPAIGMRDGVNIKHFRNELTRQKFQIYHILGGKADRKTSGASMSSKLHEYK
jgi:hypothetical protein